MAEKKETKETRETQEERIKRREQVKQQMAENANSLYWLPFSGRHGYQVAKALRNIDRDYNRILRNAGYGIPIEQAQTHQEELREYGQRMWDLVTQHIPRLHTVPVEKTYTLNNDLAERRQKAKIPASIFFLPRSSEIGWLGMAVKQIEETGAILQNTDLSALNRLITGCYDVIYKELTELEGKLSKISANKKKEKGKEKDREKDKAA